MNRFITYLIVASFAALFACTEGPSSGSIESKDVQTEFVPEGQGSASVSTSLQKLTYKIGPFDLPAGQKAVTMWESPGSINFQTEDPLWVVSFEPRIEDAAGGELPRELLHLAIVTNSSEKNPLCTEKEVANPFLAATSVTDKIELPDGHGYPVLPADQLDARVMLQNPTGQDYSKIYFKFTITAMPMRQGKGMKDVVPLMLNVDPCDYYPMAVAPKEFLKKQAKFTVPEDGLLTKAYGLIQDFGVEVALSAKDQPTPFWNARPELDKDHKIVDLPAFEDTAGIPLKAGDELSLTVVYDNPVDSWQNGAIGAVMAYVTRTGEEIAPLKMTAAEAQKMLLQSTR